MSIDEINKSFGEISEIEEVDDYFDLTVHFSELSDIAEPLLLRANKTLSKIKNMLFTTPAFLNAVKAAAPEEVMAAILTDEQKRKVAKGLLKFMQRKKDGAILATLVDPVTKDTVANIPLKNLKLSPEINQAITNYATQIQLAQIAEKIELVQKAVEDVRHGQENDRLALAFSCQQKFLQAEKIQSIEMKQAALLKIAMDAEDSRNLLMLSQKANVDFIKEQPESFWDKLLKGANPKEISSRMNEIRDSLYAVNIVSLVEAVAYQEMGEMEAAQQSLKYYGEHIHATFLDKTGFVERLDQIDDSPENYWSETIPEIERRIVSLPTAERIDELGE